jgi:hypothetical protein
LGKSTFWEEEEEEGKRRGRIALIPRVEIQIT